VNRANKYLTVLVLAHLSINIIHGAAHRELHVNLLPAGMLFVIIVILLLPTPCFGFAVGLSKTLGSTPL
jgi:hypothetical protein